MFLLPPFLQRLFKKKKGKDKRAFASEVAGLELTTQDTQSAEWMDFEEAGGNQIDKKTTSQEFEIFPADPAVRKQWFSLTIRERQVVALVCMGYRNYDIASMLGVSYPTIQTHLQKIFHKFGLRSRNEIRVALVSWPAEEWWTYHHY
ncbi:MAG TPA: helix-turn-helix transcriptional regulator [Anaerolineales bacterium]|nr:helix-turn-helix transcriptional regulator [Anaerolineales bacterium]